MCLQVLPRSTSVPDVLLLDRWGNLGRRRGRGMVLHPS